MALSIGRTGKGNPMYGKTGDQAAGWKGGKVTVECGRCSKEFYVFPYKLKKGRGKYCSKKCQLSARGQKSSTKFKKGQPPPKTCYAKNDARIIGEANKNWKGGVTPENIKIRSSEEYRIWRMAVFSRDGFTCQMCGDDKGGNLEADHIKPFWKFPELRLDVNNGRTLCKTCHTKHGYNYFREIHAK